MGFTIEGPHPGPAWVEQSKNTGLYSGLSTLRNDFKERDLFVSQPAEV